MSPGRRDNSAPNIKAVIFDVGGVLVRTHDWSGRQRWERELALQPGQAEWFVFQSDAGLHAQQGQITEAAMWRRVAADLGLDAVQLDAFRQDFWAGDALDEQLVAYIRSLRPAYQTAIISNFNDGLRASLERTYPIADAFDLIVVSAEESMMKPDERIYHLTLERLGRQPAEAVFVDDSPANVEAARAIGMVAVHYRAGMDVVAALAALGVRPVGQAGV
jgi:epoxide hydrolase-like predicted phosphatase